ncbi:MAG: hypothetical protein WKF37_15395 [Bryobacteraceae bacterium]
MIRTTEDFRCLLKAARRAGTPLLAVRTADPASAIAQVSVSLCGKTEVPVFTWDIMGGIAARNKAAKEAATHALREGCGRRSGGRTVGPSQEHTVKQFADAIVLFHNPQRMWEQIDIVQGIWNLRDVFKVGGQMLALVTTPGSVLPVELQNDVMVIDEPLPSADDLREIIPGLFESAELAVPDVAVVDQAVDALVGLAAFPRAGAGNVAFEEGLDIERLWERKRQAAEQAPGDHLARRRDFADIGGCDNIKRSYRCPQWSGIAKSGGLRRRDRKRSRALARTHLASKPR